MCDRNQIPMRLKHPMVSVSHTRHTLSYYDANSRVSNHVSSQNPIACLVRSLLCLLIELLLDVHLVKATFASDLLLMGTVKISTTKNRIFSLFVQQKPCQTTHSIVESFF